MVIAEAVEDASSPTMSNATQCLRIPGDLWLSPSIEPIPWNRLIE